MFTKFKPFLILFSVCLLFFYKTVLLGKIPFPGDLLLAGYAPWNHQSYAGYVAGAIPTKNQYFDVIRELYPWKTLALEQIKQGDIPLWNPYNFSGAPLLANYQSQVLYPFTLLYFIFPQVTAWTIMVIIQPVLGTAFLYIFASEIGLTSAAALLSAVLFNFSGFANVWVEFTTIWQTVMWLPLLLYLVERRVKQNKLYVWQQILLLVSLYCAITAGHPQDFINIFLFLIVYTIMHRAWDMLPLYAIPFFIAAPQIFPTVELYKNSARVAHDYQGIISHMLIQWWQTPLLAVSEFFGNPATGTNFTGDYVGKTLSVGVTGFFLAIASFWSEGKSWHKRFFVGTAVIILLITVRNPLSELLYRYPWPLLSTGTPTRILDLLALSLSILAGFGFDHLRKNMHIRFSPLLVTWGFFVTLWVYVFVHPGIDAAGATDIMKRAMILATGILLAVTAVTALSSHRKIVLYALIPLAAGELMYNFLKFNPFVPASFVFPQNDVIIKLKEVSGIDRFWGYGTAAVEANFATQERLFSPDGTDPLNLSWYNRFIQSSRNGDIAVTFNRTTRSDAQLAPGYGKEDLPGNEFRLRVMDELGVKYVLDRVENPKDSATYPTQRFKLLGNINDWTLYENRSASPRFYLTHDVRPYQDTKDFETQFFGDTFVPGKTVLVSRGDLNSIPPLTEGAYDASLVSYTPTAVTIRASSDTQAFLFLSDTYDNGWQASVNGKRVKVFKANFAFRGVLVPPGTSLIEFTYRPRSFQTGVTMSTIALMLTALYLYGEYRGSRKTQQTQHSTEDNTVGHIPKRKR